jgi:hypothetical protein
MAVGQYAKNRMSFVAGKTKLVRLGIVAEGKNDRYVRY